MVKISRIVMTAAAVMMIASTALAADFLSDTVKNGCQAELGTYCKDVTPGDGRVLACLYAHNDKLNAKCEYALYDAAIQLERVLATLAYAAHECQDDLEAYCADVPVGQGRLLDCVAKNEKKVSKHCLDVLAETGLK